MVSGSFCKGPKGPGAQDQRPVGQRYLGRAVHYRDDMVSRSLCKCPKCPEAQGRRPQGQSYLSGVVHN